MQGFKIKMAALTTEKSVKKKQNGKKIFHKYFKKVFHKY